MIERLGRRATARSRRMPAGRLAAAALTLLGAALVSACSGDSREADAPSSTAAVELVEIPRPDLAEAQDSVKRQIAEAESRVAESDDGGSATAIRAEAYGDLGLIYVTYTFLDAAEAAFENARRLAPEDHRWPYLLGYLFQLQGRLEEALRTFERVLELEEDDLPALIRLGAVRLELGRTEEARAAFERVVALDPTAAVGFDGLGRAAAALGDHAAAVDHFEKALSLQPQANSIRHALGLSYRSLGEREQARINLEKGGDAKALFADPLLQPVAELGRSAELFLVRGAQAFSEQRYDQAASFYRRALEIDSTDFTTHKALGFCLEKLGDLQGAIGQLEVALVAGTTGDEQKNRLERAELYRIMGGLEVLQGRDDAAIAAFRKALELDPERLSVHMKLANALARDRRFREALTHYDRVLEEIPDHSEAHLKRATVLINLGRSDQALAGFERALAAAPDDPTIRLRFAEALAFLGQSQRAAEQRAAALELAPQGSARAAVLLTEALALIPRGELDAAAGKLEQALAADPGSTDARFELARLYGHFGRYDDALENFERVIAEVPWHRPARHGEITTLLLLQRYERARERLESALEAIPRDRAVAHALARVLAAAPGGGVADGARALSVASKVHAAGPTIDTAATLALAHAAAGEFEQAAVIQRRILDETPPGVAPSRRALLEARLQAFERLRRWEARSPDELIEALMAPLPQDSRS